jgi:hypothetical protein
MKMIMSANESTERASGMVTKKVAQNVAQPVFQSTLMHNNYYR